MFTEAAPPVTEDRASKSGTKVSQETRAIRPNYNKIHALPLPIQTYPLPAFHPTNPLSLLSLLKVLVGPYLSPSSYKSHPTKYTAYLSMDTGSVVVIAPTDIRGLWEQGFFGKGSLSRSEPEWLSRERRRRAEATHGVETSEEVTRKRRDARREDKRERARKEREEIELQLREEGRLPELSLSSADGTSELLNKHVNGDIRSGAKQPISTIATDSEERAVQADERLKDVRFEEVQDSWITETEKKSWQELPRFNNGIEPEIIKDQEHLQLTPEETLFLTYGLNVLDVIDTAMNQRLDIASLLEHFRSRSYFPPRAAADLGSDDPFILSYVVYHHFRSLGWIVRPGIKFAVDWLLYLRGPAFAHAEFAVVTLPSYSHPHWTETPERAKQIKAMEGKDWWLLHAVNRVQAQAKKTLVLVYVEIPPPLHNDEIDRHDVGKVLRRYKIYDFTVKRWTSNRNRD